MKELFRILSAVLLASITLSVAACGKREQAGGAGSATPNPSGPGEPAAVPGNVVSPAAAVRVTDVQLGKSVGPDKKVQTPTEAFSPKDTIFASVLTDGTAAARVHVKWTYQDGQTVKEDSKTIAPTGPAATEFSIQKTSGWPKGNYKVEVSVNDQVASTKGFRVD